MAEEPPLPRGVNLGLVPPGSVRLMEPGEAEDGSYLADVGLSGGRSTDLIRFGPGIHEDPAVPVREG